MLVCAVAKADLVPVRQPEGPAHGFLVIRDSAGKTIGSGELVEMIRGKQMISRITLRFRDGSVDDETTVFTQDGTFHLVSDHHVQRGPSFPRPVDVTIDAASGMVTVHSLERDGEKKVTTEHIDLPPDLANGLYMMVLKNLPPTSSGAVFPMVVATPKPRLVKLAISSAGNDTFLLEGMRLKAIHYLGKIELGGVEGVIAPVVGKQPADMDMWIIGGKVPAILRVRGQFYEGGPIWDIALASPAWPAAKSGER